MARTTDRPRLRVPSPDDVATEVEGLVRDQIRRLSMALDSGASTPTVTGFPTLRSTAMLAGYAQIGLRATDGPDTAYATEDEAAEAIAVEMHEGDDGEDAEDYLARQLVERTGDVDPDGEHCLYWTSAVREDEGPARAEAIAREATGIEDRTAADFDEVIRDATREP